MDVRVNTFAWREKPFARHVVAQVFSCWITLMKHQVLLCVFTSLQIPSVSFQMKIETIFRSK